jgi:4-amino-4-deoxy-L-arabinose transferase-like glycosyltransferase
VAPKTERLAIPPGAALGVLLVAAVAANAIALRSGIRLGGDSPRYLEGADLLLRGEPLGDKALSYPGYVAVIALCRALGAGLAGVVAVQVLVQAAAVLALFSLGRTLAGVAGGLLAGGLMLANPHVVRWNAYVLTDSLYISAVVIALWGLSRVARPVRAGAAAAALAACAAGAVIRPTGWILVPIGLGVVGAAALPSRPARALCAVGAAAALILAVGAVGPLRQAVLAQRLDLAVAGGGIHRGLRIAMPPAAEDRRGLAAAAGYAARHPLAVARLGLVRAGVEVGQLRPVYSPAHNRFLALYLLGLYLAAALGLYARRRERVARLAALLIAAHLLLVAVTLADRDGRFLTYVMPLVGLLAAAGAVAVAGAVRSRRPAA